MCILCVASRWSRRIVTMLPWLIIPLIFLWALSQLLPPSFRFEVTSPRLACVGVLLFTLGWYELLMPRLSEWRAKRSLMLHERRKIEAQEAAKWRKEAIRKCRNCFMAYKDQKPVGGKFMCSYCGHLSKRPALDVPGQFRKEMRSKTWTRRMLENDLWMSVNDKCVIGGQTSGLLIVFRLVAFMGFCVWWACLKVWKGGISDSEMSRKHEKAQRKSDEGGLQESKAEKMRRKAEERRLARLEKEQMEAEERLQREEVLRLVDERRKQRANEVEANEQVKKEKKYIKDTSKVKNNVQDDSKKSKEKVKKDKKADLAKNEVVNTVKVNNVKPPTTVKNTVLPVAKQQNKVRAPVMVTTKKQDKPSVVAAAVNPTVAVTNPVKVAAKPSAWNRFSWAWGKGSTARPLQEQQPTVDSSEKLEVIQSQAINDTGTLTPAKVEPPSVDLCTPQPPPPPMDNPRQPSNPTALDNSLFHPSVSMYSSYMPPPVCNTDTQAMYGNNLVPTWKMWENPNLDILPKLNQSFLDTQPKVPPSFTHITPGVPISNNLWSDHHALESARRIWEDDMQSEATPPEFIDCITQEVMKDPVIGADGHSYERSAIEAWLKTHDTSPKTGEVLPSLGTSGGGVDKSLRPNHNLRGQIIEYRERMQRGLAASANAWQSRGEKMMNNNKGPISGGLYTPPGGDPVWAYSTS